MRRPLLALVLVAALAGAGWHFRDSLEPWLRGLRAGAVTPIAEIAAAPQRFDGREVTVAGTVGGTSEVSLGGGPPTRSYALREGRAEIMVDTQGAPPRRGQALRVTGRVSRPPGAGLSPRLAEAKRESAR